MRVFQFSRFVVTVISTTKLLLTLLNLLQIGLQVVENDPGHLGRLLQLILGVAITCDSKTDHIQALLTMEQDVQRVVMMAIQVLEEISTQESHL